ncbi:DUF5617 domain-containing protein [Legionella waltersii]|uniref:LidE n=1 Tax=Legionella waltersii TaxID=66969 RepID=A0A0W1ANN2_9GAMM|nr:DUF5617 domain-containing protein [Legionella waltersii]KTD82955.1 LidE [Legionella waltersii]SNU97341.1 LidE [Legionella waltersii]
MQSRSKENSNISTGYASSPDRAKDFAGQNQDRWQEFSKRTIEKLAGLMKSFPKTKPTDLPENCDPSTLETGVGCAYAFLAKERAKIAIEQSTNQRNDREAELFGKYRETMYDDMAGEVVMRGDSNSFEAQQEEIFKLIVELIKQAANKVMDQDGEPQHFRFKKEQDSNSTYFIAFSMPRHNTKIQSYKDKTDGFLYTITIDFPKTDPANKEHTDKLCTIRTFISKDESERGEIKPLVAYIFYPIQNSPSMVCGNFRAADIHYQACRQWTPEKGVDDFLKNAGKLVHLLAATLTVERGNSAIIEWMVRGLAREKGLELGPFKYGNGIAWDFKAFLTPNPDDYANWYATNAFSSVHRLTPKSTPPDYEKLWNETKGSDVQKAIRLLQDYTKENNNSMMFFTGHWNRHHTDLIKKALYEFKNNPPQSLKEIIGYFKKNIDINKLNTAGSLMKRLDFIAAKANVYLSTETDSTPDLKRTI